MPSPAPQPTALIIYSSINNKILMIIIQPSRCGRLVNALDPAKAHGNRGLYTPVDVDHRDGSDVGHEMV